MNDGITIYDEEEDSYQTYTAEELLTTVLRDEVIDSEAIAKLLLSELNSGSFNAQQFNNVMAAGGTHNHLQRLFFNAVIRESITALAETPQVDERNKNAVDACRDIKTQQNWSQ